MQHSCSRQQLHQQGDPQGRVVSGSRAQTKREQSSCSTLVAPLQQHLSGSASPAASAAHVLDVQSHLGHPQALQALAARAHQAARGLPPGQRRELGADLDLKAGVGWG